MAIALKEDNLKTLTNRMGCQIQAAFSATRTHGPDRYPSDKVCIGDLEEMQGGQPVPSKQQGDEEAGAYPEDG